ncbi:Clp protease N-terminal domain-containing protein [Herbidospora daliensis]|uniref:Clp protease N-terminal domain-containing protein n=1 Tax=Herbidospora daliensis TaxID=295585 RepID=UPI000780287D|nr:Clp protease N-terminal domain-containing protein [Herbidospora daliensis]
MREPVERLLTANAARVLALADRHAPDVLAALLENGEGVAILCLRRLGVSPHDLITTPTSGPTTVLEQARRQAHLLGHRYIGTEHLLLALAEEDPELLARLGTDPATLRRLVVHVLREPVPTGWTWP